MYPQCVEQNKKNITLSQLKIIFLYSREKMQYLTWACFRNDSNSRFNVVQFCSDSQIQAITRSKSDQVTSVKPFQSYLMICVARPIISRITVNYY